MVGPALGAFVLLAALLFAPAARAGETPLQAGPFTAHLAELLKAAAPKASFKVTGPLTLEVQGGNGASTASLDNLYSDCLRNRAICDQLVADRVAKMATYYATPNPPLQRAQLRVVVRPSATVQAIRQAAAAVGADAVAQPLAGDYWLVAVADQPTTIILLNTKLMAPLGLSTDAAIALGKANLRRDLARQLDRPAATHASGIIGLTGDPYASSLLAFPDLWAPMARAAGGDLLVSAPAADVMMADVGGGAGAVKALTEAAQDVVAHADRPLSAAVFRWSESGWVEVTAVGRRRHAKAAAP